MNSSGFSGYSVVSVILDMSKLRHQLMPAKRGITQFNIVDLRIRIAGKLTLYGRNCVRQLSILYYQLFQMRP